jgi:hypothetical protein
MSQTHPNGLGQTGSVGPAPHGTLTLIPSPTPATGSRPHCRRSNPASSGGFRRCRMAPSLRRHLLHHLTTGNRVLCLCSLPPSRTRHRCRGGPSCAPDLLASALRRLGVGKECPGRRCRLWPGAGSAPTCPCTVVPLYCHAAVPPASAFSSVLGKTSPFSPLPSSILMVTI